jgi:hypothetical protein
MNKFSTACGKLCGKKIPYEQRIENPLPFSK